MSSCVCLSVCSHVCLSVPCVSSSLESGNGMDTLCKVLIWGFPCKYFHRVLLQLMSSLGLSLLLQGVEGFQSQCEICSLKKCGLSSQNREEGL